MSSLIRKHLAVLQQWYKQQTIRIYLAFFIAHKECLISPFKSVPPSSVYIRQLSTGLRVLSTHGHISLSSTLYSDSIVKGRAHPKDLALLLMETLCTLWDHIKTHEDDQVWINLPDPSLCYRLLSLRPHSYTNDIVEQLHQFCTPLPVKTALALLDSASSSDASRVASLILPAVVQ